MGGAPAPRRPRVTCIRDSSICRVALTLVLGVSAGAWPASATDVALTSAKSRATLRDSQNPKGNGAMVRWTEESALGAPLALPLCPNTSSIEIATGMGNRGPIALPCGNWRPAGTGYAYSDPTAAAGGVFRVVLKSGTLLLELEGPNYPGVGGPVAFVEASLTVGGTRYCGRFQAPPSQFRKNQSTTIVVRGPSIACVPPPTATPTASPTPSPPLNFLVVDLDDTRPDGMDRMAVVQSRLAPESVTFDNSFVPLSSCCPSRASFLSGLYAVHHGTRQVAGPIGGAKTFRESGADQQTIAVWLHDAGYATGLFGKYLNEYNVESNKGPGGSYYIPPGWTRWRAFVSEHYGGFYGPSYDLVDERGAVTSYDDHTTDAQYSTDVTADALRQFIRDTTTTGRPFFALWVPYASHADTPTLTPVPAEQDFNTLADLPLFRPPNWDEADRSDKPRWVQARLDTPLLEASTDVIRERAYETLLDVDRQLGAMLDQLETLGIADHTVVLLTSDNGVAWGEHAQFFQTKSCPYEECLRVSFMIHVPGGAGLGTVTSPVLNIDVAPTIADLAGISVPVPVDGQSIRPALDGAPDWLRDDFLLEQWRDARNASITYSGLPADGDRLRLYYGPDLPKTVATFEFDDGDGVEPNNIPVIIQGTADATFQALGNAVDESIPHAVAQLDTNRKQLNILDTSAALTGFYWWDEVNQGSGFQVSSPMPDFFGVRDVRNGFTYVQYEDGEAELYDLTLDPWQLNNAIDDPSYAAVRAAYDARMRELAGLP